MAPDDQRADLVRAQPLPQAVTHADELPELHRAIDTIAPPAALPERRADLRRQRLIRDAEPTSTHDVRENTAPTHPTVGPRVQSERPAAPSTSPVHRPRRRLPVLPGIASGPDAVVRRLTIPRAMSAIHRPDTTLDPRPVAPARMDAARSFEWADGIVASRTSTATPPFPRSIVDRNTADRSPVEMSTVEMSTVGRRAEGPASHRPTDASIIRRRVAPLRLPSLPTVLPTGHHDPAIAEPPSHTSSRESATVVPSVSVDIRRASVAPPAAHRRTPLEAPGEADRPDVVERGSDRGDHSNRHDRGRSAITTGRVLRRARARHLTDNWSLVQRGSGALGEAVRPTTDLSAVPAAPRDDDLAERFMSELSRSIRRSPAPLPTPFRPMADHITGGRKVLLATDDASRRALRSVGKVAATTGDTIHLDTAAATRKGLNAVVAHELTHVANPSPAPRFFDDVVDSPEERRADATARIMARSPLAPTSSILSAPGTTARRSADTTIRRSPAAPTPTSGSTTPGSVSASALAASITGGSTASSPDVIRRWNTAQPSGRPPEIGSARQRGNSTTSPTAVEPAAPAFSLQSPDAQRWFEQQLERNIDTIVRRIRDQVVIDLERRGGRLWGDL